MHKQTIIALFFSLSLHAMDEKSLLELSTYALSQKIKIPIITVHELEKNRTNIQQAFAVHDALANPDLRNIILGYSNTNALCFIDIAEYREGPFNRYLHDMVEISEREDLEDFIGKYGRISIPKPDVNYQFSGLIIKRTESPVCLNQSIVISTAHFINTGPCLESIACTPLRKKANLCTWLCSCFYKTKEKSE